MILVAVDDLLFSSKIRTTAKLAGVELTFARTPSEIIDQARALRPALVIFDLNSVKADPIETVKAMKRDADLAAIRTLGFVSHVHTELIDAAREAGIDEVMARSAFAGRLADILLAGSPSSGLSPSVRD
jgi:PleD family two-component response regulator